MRAAVIVAVGALLLASCTSSKRGPAPSPPVAAPTTSSADSPTTTPLAAPSVDWPTYHGDAARSGVSRTFPRPAKLTVMASLGLDEAVYASPIVARGITIVASENNTVYALDTAGRQLWRTHLGDPVPGVELPCGNIDPSGITATPIYDRATDSVFVVPEYRAPVRHELVALAVQTGMARWRVGIDLPGASANAMQVRGALAIAAGRVWVPFGGRNGDCGDYKGRVVGVPVSGSGPVIAYTVPTTRQAGIWTPPGPSVDSRGRLIVSVGNGESGTGDPYDYSDSVLAIDPPTARLVDSFSPTTWAMDNEADRDLGSQGPALIGSGWVFIAGKSGVAYVLRQDQFGGIGGQVTEQELCRSFGGTAVDDAVVYVPCTDGMCAVRVGTDGSITVLWHADAGIAGSPVVGGGRVWALDQRAGVLHALDPANGRSTAQIQVGQTTRFATPALSGGHVLVPTLSGITIVSVT